MGVVSNKRDCSVTGLQLGGDWKSILQLLAVIIHSDKYDDLCIFELWIMIMLVILLANLWFNTTHERFPEFTAYSWLISCVIYLYGDIELLELCDCYHVHELQDHLHDYD